MKNHKDMEKVISVKVTVEFFFFLLCTEAVCNEEALPLLFKLSNSYRIKTEQERYGLGKGPGVLDSSASLNPSLDWKMVLMATSQQIDGTTFLVPSLQVEAWNHCSGSQMKRRRCSNG